MDKVEDSDTTHPKDVQSNEYHNKYPILLAKLASFYNLLSGEDNLALEDNLELLQNPSQFVSTQKPDELSQKNSKNHSDVKLGYYLA